jgi:hypothetical protein
MQINKAKATAIIVIVLMMTSIAAVALPVQAQDEAHGGDVNGFEGPSTIPAGETADFTIYPDAFLSASPHLIGLGQQLLVNMWITFPSGEGKYMHEYVVTITDPDGNTEEKRLNSYVADGTSWFNYVPDQVGDWTFVMNFPGEWFPAGYYRNGQYSETRTGDFSNAIYNPSDYVAPAKSNTVVVTVQNELVSSFILPLPTDLWSRPIQPNNRDWYQIAGNYPWSELMDGGQNSWDQGNLGPFVTAPNTPHILRYRQGALAGLIGGEAGQYTMTGNPGTPDVIFMGRGYDTRTSFVTNIPTTCAACFDIQTGEVYYAIPTSQGGVTPTYINYIYGTGEASGVSAELLTISGSGSNQRLYKINPFTGAVTTNVSLPSTLGSVYFYRDGYVLSFYRNSSLDGQVTNGNITVNKDYTGYLVNWSVSGSSSNFNSRIVSNITVTIPNSYRTIYQIGSYGALGSYDPETGITIVGSRFIYGGYYGSMYEAVNLVTGQLLWNISTPVTKMESMYRPTNTWHQHGIYVCEMELGYWQARSAFDGHILWETHMDDVPWGEFWMYDEAAYGDLLLGTGYTGVWALNETNGDIAWHYVDPAVPFESPYNSANGTIDCYPVQSIIVADGKVYVSNTEHTPSAPSTRGWGLICLNATTGEKLWKISGTLMGPGPCADGYMASASSYDGNMYILGKGPSKTTVTAPQTAVPVNSKVLIQGTVLDMSPGQPETACIADENMDTWMDYLHFQMPSDGYWHNVTVMGVPVDLYAIDSNGNTVSIGTATSDTSGSYQMEWTPTAEGLYKVTASFAGSDSYGSSWAEAGLSVGPAVEPVVIPEQPTPADNTMLLYGILVAVIIAIVLAVIALVVIFQKK